MPKEAIIILTPKIIHEFHVRYYPYPNEDGCFIWKGAFTRYGYGRLVVTECGIQQQFLAHRISYMIHNNLKSLYQELVLHKCPNGGNKACVNPIHLAIGTQAENVNDKVLANNQTKGEDSNLHILTEQEVIQIRLEWATGEYTQLQLANRYGVNQSTISLIVTRRSWKHI